ncbi:uncharacterized protein LOC120016698 isoform X2 [Tripterygium wilfordii]|uniref:uncharacterized protein LOC120016698 isoform X2 n=1 Tax=Tripterygium wilfordii TaxID=458696 RepID=UPI0018F847FC|nr:uncharacterized protein LOC120016698 isoform X2 [Tripterygium wilfordii]
MLFHEIHLCPSAREMDLFDHNKDHHVKSLVAESANGLSSGHSWVEGVLSRNGSRRNIRIISHDHLAFDMETKIPQKLWWMTSMEYIFLLWVVALLVGQQRKRGHLPRLSETSLSFQVS